MKKIICLIGILSLVQSTPAQSWNDTLAMIEKIVARYQPDKPGAQLAVSRNGQLLFSGMWGMADLEHNVSMTRTSMIEAGSVSKQFTAAAVLLLAQQNKLSLQDDVRKYIPELPNYGNIITLHHLMQHTSGLRDWGVVMELSGWPRGTRNYTNEHALFIICRQKMLNNKPGDEFIYSNSNYTLLAIIVERVSGKNLQEFTNENIFRPAGMKHTEWRTNMKKVVPGRAIAYAKDGKTYLTNMPNENVYGHAGLLTTAEDLLAWNEFYLSAKLGSSSLLSKQLSTNPLTYGGRNTYAAGLMVDSARGWRIITHSGATASYRANLDNYPDLDLSIAWLSNTSEFERDSVSVVNAITKLLVKNISKPAAKAEKTPDRIIGAETLNRYIGWYKSSQDGWAVRISTKDNALYGNNGLMRPVSDHIFLVGSNTIEFLPGKYRQAIFLSPAGDTVHFTGVDSAVINEKTLQEYAGNYYSDEAEAMFTIAVKDGKLWLRQKPSSEYQISSRYKDGFTCSFGPLYFERNKAKKITGFKISPRQARNVEFVRVTDKK